ncbi:hypothetical protein BUALT_Bualt03G0063800 [Buddleja alternifolia]|uniref:DUF4408 domain-containing protein n=1 Tax=Buddleja alternifolia TaxID=168488 RepID=A0AAV6XTS0_9LAMI|nr:hypothetical protein BUALT_Bualt03G0063800 [Buddleja alternifolia]
MGAMNTWILSMKVFLISAGFVALAMGLKFSVPIAMNGIPAMWSIILSWMKPPYLYIIINGIIITIAASSRFHHSQSEPSVRSEHLISVKTPPPSGYASLVAQPEIRTIIEESTAAAEVVMPESEDKVVDLNPVIVNGSTVDIETVDEEDETVIETEAEADAEAKDVFVESNFTYNNTLPQEIISPELQFESLLSVREKPLVLSRFGHRKPIRSTPEVPGVRALRVAKPKRHETLESTWKMITEGRHVPLTRHLKKSDTFEHHTRHVSPAVDHVPKSATFKDRFNYESPAAASFKIRREPSLGQDELNRRVEAFIKKTNEEMRMQRQESLNQYMEMINRGV